VTSSHHPYDTFKPWWIFAQAAEDPHARHQADPPDKFRLFVQELIEAARNGKQVTVIIELKARFDEAANIKWARLMREAVDSSGVMASVASALLSSAAKARNSACPFRDEIIIATAKNLHDSAIHLPDAVTEDCRRLTA
jgi:hypothetical protein